MSGGELLELLKLRERSKPPLLVYHGCETLPQTPQAVIEAAKAAGRSVVHIHFVKPDGSGRPASGHLEGSATV